MQVYTAIMIKHSQVPGSNKLVRQELGRRGCGDHHLRTLAKTCDQVYRHVRNNRAIEEIGEKKRRNKWPHARLSAAALRMEHQPRNNRLSEDSDLA